MVKNIEMVNRELQIGGRITLPIDWRREMGLKVGSEVIMKIMDHKIVIELPIKLTSLRGMGKTKRPSKDPKKDAREWVKKQVKSEMI